MSVFVMMKQEFERYGLHRSYFL